MAQSAGESVRDANGARGSVPPDSTSNDLCVNGGDSGSPYFSHGVAYGIHVVNLKGGGCDIYGKAEHALEAASRMNVYILEK